MTKSMRERFAAQGDGSFTLAGIDPGATAGMKDKVKARKYIESLGPSLRESQLKLYAAREQSVLLILQGMDACGKDGVVKHVIGLFYPTSVRVTAFKAPSDEEKQHDFLWRFGPVVPKPGNIGVFNRSHYEDVGTVKVHNWATPAMINSRYTAINKFEKKLAASGVTVIKCFLHVSPEEQRQRMLDRLADPTRRWKFKERDLDESDRWDEYMSAYDVAINRCNTEAAPWYVIPADHKWYRDWVIAQLLVEAFAEIDPQYPEMADLDIPTLMKRIKASGRVAT